MDNALHEPQTIVLLGGTSDIGLAIVRELLSPPRNANLQVIRTVMPPGSRSNWAQVLPGCVPAAVG